MYNALEEERLRAAIEAAPVLRMDQNDAPDQYRSLAFTLVEDLYRYVTLTGGKGYEDMGLEIVETAHSCLSSYDREKGPFLHYFQSALKRRVHREAALRSAAKKRGDVALPEHVQRQLFQLEAIARAKELPVEDETVVRTAAAVLELSEDRIRALIRLDRQFRSVPDRVQDPEREEASLFDLIPGGPALEEGLLERQSAQEFLAALERCYLQCRESQREVLSKLLTARILTGCPPDLFRQCSQAAYFDADMYRRCLDTGTVPSGREIAAELGRHEASISRTMTRFLENLNMIKENAL